jgi:capsular polysaccharide biosynthesis protein
VPAVIPVLPLASLSTVLVIGFVLALAAGVAATYVAEFLDPSLRTPRDVIDSLEIPIVASVPEGAFGEAFS